MKKVAFFLFLILIGGISLFVFLFFNQKRDIAYSGVFLTNGQVYFGHITEQTSTVITLSDVFYLRANPQLEQNTKKKDTTALQGNVNLSLIKLGSEIHGPTNTIHIAMSQVLFWETLRSDSKIVQAIANYPK